MDMTKERIIDSLKRINIKEILKNPELRKELIVNTIIAIQAREGIETTKEQAEMAYDKIRKEKK